MTVFQKLFLPSLLILIVVLSFSVRVFATQNEASFFSTIVASLFNLGLYLNLPFVGNEGERTVFKIYRVAEVFELYGTREINFRTLLVSDMLKAIIRTNNFPVETIQHTFDPFIKAIGVNLEIFISHLIKEKKMWDRVKELNHPLKMTPADRYRFLETKFEENFLKTLAFQSLKEIIPMAFADVTKKIITLYAALYKKQMSQSQYSLAIAKPYKSFSILIQTVAHLFKEFNSDYTTRLLINEFLCKFSSAVMKNIVTRIQSQSNILGHIGKNVLKKKTSILASQMQQASNHFEQVTTICVSPILNVISDFMTEVEDEMEAYTNNFKGKTAEKKAKMPQSNARNEYTEVKKTEETQTDTFSLCLKVEKNAAQIYNPVQNTEDEETNAAQRIVLRENIEDEEKTEPENNTPRTITASEKKAIDKNHFKFRSDDLKFFIFFAFNRIKRSIEFQLTAYNKKIDSFASLIEKFTWRDKCWKIFIDECLDLANLITAITNIFELTNSPKKFDWQRFHYSSIDMASVMINNAASAIKNISKKFETFRYIEIEPKTSAVTDEMNNLAKILKLYSMIPTDFLPETILAMTGKRSKLTHVLMDVYTVFNQTPYVSHTIEAIGTQIHTHLLAFNSAQRSIYDIEFKQSQQVQHIRAVVKLCFRLVDLLDSTVLLLKHVGPQDFLFGEPLDKFLLKISCIRTNEATALMNNAARKFSVMKKTELQLKTWVVASQMMKLLKILPPKYPKRNSIDHVPNLLLSIFNLMTAIKKEMGLRKNAHHQNTASVQQSFDTNLLPFADYIFYSFSQILCVIKGHTFGHQNRMASLIDCHYKFLSEENRFEVVLEQSVVLSKFINVVADFTHQCQSPNQIDWQQYHHFFMEILSAMMKRAIKEYKDVAELFNDLTLEGVNIEILILTKKMESLTNDFKLYKKIDAASVPCAIKDIVKKIDNELQSRSHIFEHFEFTDEAKKELMKIYNIKEILATSQSILPFSDEIEKRLVAFNNVESFIYDFNKDNSLRDQCIREVLKLYFELLPTIFQVFSLVEKIIHREKEIVNGFFWTSKSCVGYTK